jgi:hypothetical protein
MTATAAGYLLETSLDLKELESQHGGTLTIDEARDVARSLGAMARGHQWWIGDLLVYGEEQFGEEFAQIEAELELEPRTAGNYRWVADKVAATRRRDDLSWSHHAEVARLKPAAQKTLLKWAADEKATVRDLRIRVAIEFPQAAGEPREPLPGLEPAEEHDVQKRLELIERALEAGNMVDLDDVRWLLLLAKRLTRGGRG